MQLPINNFQVTTPALLFDPEFYIFDVSADLKTTKFLICDEKKIALAPFIDIRFEPLSQGQFTVPSKDLFELESMHNVPRAQSAYIFHHAFVCSTLLARCLNQIDIFFSLKEPWILRRLSDFKRAQRQSVSDEKWQEMFTGYSSLLAKNYYKAKTPVIKATNVANNLITDVIKYLPKHKILYLYSDLESFLISNLKKPQETQVKMPELAAKFMSDSNFYKKYSNLFQLNELTFLQICALVWVVNLYNLKASTEGFQLEHIKTLDMNDFLEDMGGSLKSISQFFGHNPTASEVALMLDPSITQTNSKHQQLGYNEDMKQQESDIVLHKFGDEIQNVQQWISPLVNELEIIKYCADRKL
ncbi:MAG: hypothetical protein ABJH06_09935 [Paraglaciecola sp.]|uniref:hypothetical protein n=1 Tax=Paraglaciecola sp. TaxID=1920173 RepID=UPI003298327D